MYLDYWALQERPFEPNAGPDRFFATESLQGASLKLRYVLENRLGAAALAGETGVGKTALLASVLAQLPPQFDPIVRLPVPTLSPTELLSFLVAELCGDDPAEAQTSSFDRDLRRLRKRLAELTGEGRAAVVAVDDAHLIDDGRTLELLRLLLGIEEGPPALQWILAGQTDLLSRLIRMPDLDQRLGAKCFVRPFTPAETADYVLFRLSAAGARREIFTDDAFQALPALTGGAPRRIDRLCDLALLIGFAEERTLVDADLMQDVAAELAPVSAGETFRDAA
ncbi:MAG TPA: AAA family ATPase [Pirellulaceae bacterium]|jgi:general secretion pathway protein A|nr:AAA family ATPase [Pirellulaceae bacterium]